MSLVLVVSMLTLFLSASPAGGAEEARALDEPEDVIDDEAADDERGTDRSLGDDEEGDVVRSPVLARLTGAFAGALATVAVHVLAYAGASFGGFVFSAVLLVASSVLVGGISAIPEFFALVPPVALVLGYLGVFTFCMAAALDVVTDAWIAVVVAPVLAALTLVGPPVGVVVGTMLGYALGIATAFGFVLALGLEVGSMDAQGVGFVGILLGTFAGFVVGGIVGYGTTSFVIPTGVIALLADDPRDWRRPFTSFTE